MIFFVADLFVENYKGGAELTTEAIYQSSLLPVNKVHSSSINLNVLKQYKDSFWIFGNFADLSEDCLLYAIKNLKYSVLEYDYKYCTYRSPGKHIEKEGECDCHTLRRGKIVAMFLAVLFDFCGLSEVELLKSRREALEVDTIFYALVV